MEPVILFDGVCNLCNQSVQFIIKRDSAGVFKFASLQGETGQLLLKEHGFPADDLNSFVLVENGLIYTKSTAALRVCGQLPGLWKILAVLRIVPAFLRDGVYEFVARNRYKWFGKTESCMLPRREWKQRFLD